MKPLRPYLSTSTTAIPDVIQDGNDDPPVDSSVHGEGSIHANKRCASSSISSEGSMNVSSELQNVDSSSEATTIEGGSSCDGSDDHGLHRDDLQHVTEEDCINGICSTDDIGRKGLDSLSLALKLNTPKEVIRGDAVVKLLIAQSNRGHDIGAEGIWDNVPADTVDEINRLNASQRREYHKAKRSKRPSMWDQALDQGRVKKIKKKISEDDGDAGGSNKRVNSFQDVADNRLLASSVR